MSFYTTLDWPKGEPTSPVIERRPDCVPVATSPEHFVAAEENAAMRQNFCAVIECSAVPA
jgi:hypothetical protein